MTISRSDISQGDTTAAAGNPAAVGASIDPTAPVGFVLQYVDHGVLVRKWFDPVFCWSAQAELAWLRSLQFLEYVALLPVFRDGVARAKARLGDTYVGFNHAADTLEGKFHHGEKYTSRSAHAFRAAEARADAA